MFTHALITVLLSINSAWCQSTPAYLKPNNPAPTGHFDLKILKSRAIGIDQFEWLWVRDAKGHNGWLLKSSALLPLDFSRQALLMKGQAIHSKPEDLLVPQKSLNQSQIVTLVDRFRDWYKIIYLENDIKYYGWVRSRFLNPHSKDAGYFFSTVETHLRMEPKMKAQILKNIEPGLPIIPISIKEDWALVEFAGTKGYIPFKNIKSRMDVSIKVRTDKGYFQPHASLYKNKILEIFSNPVWVGTGAYSIDLKEKPDMGSNTVTVIEPWQSLALQGYSVKKWSKSNIPHWGDLWWPETTIESNVEIIESVRPQLTYLKKSDIYQIEKSPVVPNLVFASTTHGVYRSFDGKSWYPLNDFKHGFPIKVANDGTLFVADQVSFDHGESFSHFIRWDKVFDTMPNNSKLSSGPVQIINVEPNPNNHRNITLSLKVGTNKYLQIYTPDMGQSWRLR
jgi:SH3-like domain-containing protein